MFHLGYQLHSSLLLLLFPPIPMYYCYPTLCNVYSACLSQCFSLFPHQHSSCHFPRPSPFIIFVIIVTYLIPYSVRSNLCSPILPSEVNGVFSLPFSTSYSLSNYSPTIPALFLYLNSTIISPFKSSWHLTLIFPSSELFSFFSHLLLSSIPPSNPSDDPGNLSLCLFFPPNSLFFYFAIFLELYLFFQKISVFQ